MAAFIAAVLLASLVPTTVAVAADGGGRDEDHPYVEGEALVGAKRGDKDEAEEEIEEEGGEIVSYYEPGNFFVVETPGRAPDWARAVGRSRNVKFAEPNYIVEAEDITPNDPRLGDLYGLQKIGAPAAWEESTGSNEVVVGIIDTGVDYTHEDIGPSQMWTNPGEIAGNGLDDDINGYVDDVHGLDCRNNDGDPMDDNEHGTHVAGTIGAETDNSIGVAGINWDVDIMGLKFLSASGSGSTADAIECLDYAIAEGANLTNNSWGGGGYSQALRDAIQRAADADQLFVAAAGNSSDNTDDSPHYPSTYDNDNIVSVAATDSSDNLASFSTYGPTTVDLAAPGVGIWSTVPGDAYDSFSGTSMATPHVAGAAALVLARYPSLRNDYEGLLERLYGSVDPISSVATRVATGGRLNLARAIENDVTDPDASALNVGTVTRTSVALSWSAPADDPLGTQSASSYTLRVAPAGSGNWATAPAPKPAAPGTSQNATVGGLLPATAYDFSLLSRDNVGNTSEATAIATTGNGAVVFSDDMEGGSSLWSSNSPWAITTERPGSPTHSWSDSPNGSYANSKDVSITSAPFSLAGATAPKLTFWHRHGLEQGFDYGYALISTNGGSTYTQLARYNGHSGLKPVEFDLAPYAGATDVRLRFRLTSDTIIVYDGWYVDDVIVSAGEVDATPPDAPGSLTATAGTTFSNLDWSDNTEGDLGNYVVYRTTDAPAAPTRTWSAISTPIVSTYKDSAVSAGTTYYYRVTAKDQTGNESPPSNEASATPTAPQTKTFAPGTVTVLTGNSAGNPVSRLTANDSAYYSVSSVRSGSPHVTSWYGQATIDVAPAAVTKLTLTYDGDNTRSVTQSLYVWNFSTSTWVRFSNTTVGTADKTFTFATTSPAQYISGLGQIRMRVGTSKTQSHTSRGDLMSFRIDY